MPARGQRRGDPPGVVAAAIGQPALVVVAPDLKAPPWRDE